MERQTTREARLAERIEQAIDRSSRNVEEIHRAIADLPLEVMANAGLFETTARDLKQIQDESIGLVYDGVRQVNHRVHQIAADLLGSLDEAPQD